MVNSIKYLLLILLIAYSPTAWAGIFNPSGTGGSGVSTFNSDTDDPATCTPGDLAANGLFLNTTTGVLSYCETTDTLTPLNPAEAQGLDDVVAIERTYGGATSQATAVRIGSSAAGVYVSIGYDATLGAFMTCEVAGVLDDCDKAFKLLTGHKFEVTNNSGTPILTLTESTGALTNTTLSFEGSGNAITVPFRWDLDLCAVSPIDETTVSHVWNADPLSTAPTPTAVVGTNRGTCRVSFPDSDGDIGVGITKQIPDGTFTGSFDADIWWTTTGTGNARFQFQTLCYADDEADDASFNTASVVTAAAGTSGRPNKQTITGITTTGCAGGELMRIRFYRNRTEASDSLNAALTVEKVVFKGRVIE